jgi:hypothetical protein
VTNPFLIYTFYDLLENVCAELDLMDKPQCIFNIDESAFFVDPKGGRLYGGVGDNVQRITSGPGRTCFTVMVCVNAAGRSLPPLFIFQGKHLYSSWKGTDTSVLPGTTYACTGKYSL